MAQTKAQGFSKLMARLAPKVAFVLGLLTGLAILVALQLVSQHAG